MKKYLAIITWTIISLVLVCFIFSNSFACKEVSIELSRGITDLLYDCVKSILKLSFDEFHGLVRKVAHFVEFALFGASVWMTMDSARNLGRRFNVETVLFLSLTVAVIDEFIPELHGARKYGCRCDPGFRRSAVWNRDHCYNNIFCKHKKTAIELSFGGCFTDLS